MEKYPNPEDLRHPIVNIDENIGKTVGRRKVKDGFLYAMGMQETAGELQKSFGGPRFPKGVFRFRSFEEADAWMMKYMTQAQS